MVSFVAFFLSGTTLPRMSRKAGSKNKPWSPAWQPIFLATGGTIAKLAVALDVSVGTVKRWRDGAAVHERFIEKVRATAAAHGATSPV